uniref:Histone-lysine N-methyltransferase SETMAR (inferred by orthology to a human protein) n=1 Tax=Strongyloides venezuelensis TaxID=75913 RepID=A0A0K0F1L0_STRVS
MLSNHDIRNITLYEFKRCTNAAKTTQQINECFGEDLVSVSTVQRWFRKFKESSEDLENEERGRPESKIEKAKELDNWVPHKLNDYKKLCHYEVCSFFILRNKNDTFLSRLITCDKKWILDDNHKRTGQWLNKDKAPKHFPKYKLKS